jgi:endonuclease YncB( thermonuclease family)
MKNVIKPVEHHIFAPAESNRPGIPARMIPTVALGVTLLVIPLTGCFDPDIGQPVYSAPADTRDAVQVEEVVENNTVSNELNSSGDVELPYGVTLQVDPSVLVPCDLERVVDGDTIIVHDPDGKRLRVRLTGINAEESVHEDESKNTDKGREASQFMKDLLEDVDVVYLEYDVEEFDQYERTLAYVWIDSGDTYIMVNEIMLATDNAEPVYIKPNLKYADDFRHYEG